ncbi:hypothetical protein ACS6ZU_07325 [Streptococcus suis]
MFTIYNIRERARQTLNETPGIYQLAVIPRHYFCYRSVNFFLSQ